MRLESISIEYYRSIERLKIYFPENRPVVLFGPNNAGKSNILSAINRFFVNAILHILKCLIVIILGVIRNLFKTRKSKSGSSEFVSGSRVHKKAMCQTGNHRIIAPITEKRLYRAKTSDIAVFPLPPRLKTSLKQIVL